MIGVLAFGADLYVGPASGLLLIGLAGTRRWTRHRRIVAALGAVNLMLALLILATVADGLGRLVLLVGFQAVASAAVVVSAMTHRR
jgi:hypothetical protein